MHTATHYAKAPITEALLDIRVELPTNVQLSTLLSLYQSIESEYPHLENMLAVESSLTTGPSVITQTKTAFTGYRFWSADRKKVFQARLDGFTFSQLEPYESWDILRKDAQKLWELYKSAVKPKCIKRVALRYINRINLPLPLDDFSDYLRTIPTISPQLSQSLSDYLMQLIIPQEDLGGSLVLTEALIPPTEEDDQNLLPILLDIDLFCEVDLQPDSYDYWELLETMRTRKNEIFEACITDKTRELIK
jgi:uncharacterized protein (TIGR04255 family)